ncbi:hypothetical protein LXL04_020925 [Taraxacum kok-saghyz]
MKNERIRGRLSQSKSQCVDNEIEECQISILVCTSSSYRAFLQSLPLHSLLSRVTSKYPPISWTGMVLMMCAFGLSADTTMAITAGASRVLTLKSTDDSQIEEHYGLFFQVLLDMLSRSASVLSVLSRESKHLVHHSGARLKRASDAESQIMRS